MGAETAMYIRKGGEGKPSGILRDMLIERDRRRAEQAANPEPPIETPRDRAARLAQRRHAMAHARELAPKIVDVTTGEPFDKELAYPTEE